MKQSIVALCLVGLVSALAIADDEKRYTLADLKTLLDQKSYQEVIDHLQDVPPAARKDDYVAIAGQAAAAMVAKQPTDMEKLIYMVRLEEASPVVLSSPTYLAARNVAPAGFDECFANSGSRFGTCRDYALVFVDNDPKNGTLALAIAKSVRRGMSHFASVPFFKRALAASKPKAVCPDEDLELAVVSGLGLDASDTRLAEATELAATCWSDVKDAIGTELAADGAGAEFHDHACALLKAKKSLTGDQKKLCAISKSKS